LFHHRQGSLQTGTPFGMYLWACVLIVVVSQIPGKWNNAALAAEQVYETPNQVMYVTEGNFADIRENLDLAITGQGLIIDHVSHVGTMLDTTGKDLGATRQVYLQAEVLAFCSATLSREMLEANPFNLVYCPYTIQIFETPEQPGKVYVGYRRPKISGSEASRIALKKVDDLLADIVSEALTW
jgi:hypothetical protein